MEKVGGQNINRKEKRNTGHLDVQAVKIGFVGSSGGHLAHLYRLKPFWEQYERFWVTFDKEDARSLLSGERFIPCVFPTNHSLQALVKNTVLAWKVLRRERPSLLVSTGAAAAFPFFLVGKLFHCKLVFIEVYDRFDRLSLTGRLVYPLADRFFVQWPELQKKYPRAKYIGNIFGD